MIKDLEETEKTFKKKARRLQQALAKRNYEIPYTLVLHIYAYTEGFENYHVFKASIEKAQVFHEKKAVNEMIKPPK
jgi:hypothetical protein